VKKLILHIGKKEYSLDSNFTKSWRYKIGLGLIILGHLILIIGLLLPVLGLDPSFLAILIICGELITLSSIIFLGKDGFIEIKNKIFYFIKTGYTASVGPVRHYIGIALLSANILTTFTLAVYAWIAFNTTTLEIPMPVIWGLNFSQQGYLVLWLFLTGEISFLISLYVLGADWWERFRNIIIWQKPSKAPLE